MLGRVFKAVAFSSLSIFATMLIIRILYPVLGLSFLQGHETGIKMFKFLLIIFALAINITIPVLIITSPGGVLKFKYEDKED